MHALSFFSVVALVTTVAAKNFEFFGVNESGPEFGEGVFPGVKGKHYVWPTLASIDPFLELGMNTIRINFLAERLIPNKQTGPMDPTYFKDLKEIVDHITTKGAYAMIVPHNYGRYYKNIITDVAGFQAYWKTVATAFKSNSKVIFDTNNEYHTMDQNLVVRLNQAAINGIREAGATTQWITPEGNSWSGAHSWTTINGPTMGTLKDPQNKLIYQMHQYFNKYFSGERKNTTCTHGKETLVGATKWLRDNKKLGIIGEYAGDESQGCKNAVKGALEYMVQNKDVWKGAIYWSAGPWWDNAQKNDYYYASIEPPPSGKETVGGRSWKAYMPILMQYA